jgi:hypothetical protein
MNIYEYIIMLKVNMQHASGCSGIVSGKISGQNFETYGT